MQYCCVSNICSGDLFIEDELWIAILSLVTTGYNPQFLYIFDTHE